MNNLFSLAESVLLAVEVEAKLRATQEAWRLYQSGLLDFSALGEPLPIMAARVPERPQRVEPRSLPKRKLSSLAGRVALLHAVAHIEFTAIQLAWDHLYRFRGLPLAYYRDWLDVAQEEARHFQMVRTRLMALGSDYGELPAHGGLWDIAVETAYDPLARMALVPRFMEARGLDVTPGMIERLRAVEDLESVAVLELILREEVRHVALGSYWFAWLCESRGLVAESSYFELLGQHIRGAARGPYNLPLRRQAGFSDGELARLESSGQAEIQTPAEL